MAVRLKPGSIRGELALFVAVLALPLLGLIAYGAYDRAQHDVADAEAAVRRQAEIAADRATRFVEDTRTALETIARRPLVRAMDAQRCDPGLKDLLELYPRAVNFLVVDREGRILCGAIPPPRDRVLRIQDETLLREILANGRFALSQPVVGRINRRWTVAAVQPVRGDAGEVVGTVSMSIDLLTWNPLQGAAGIPAGAVVTLLSGGVVIARSADAEQWIGRDASSGEILRHVRELKEGTVRARGAAEVDRIWGFRPVPGTGWTALSGIPTEVVFAPVRERALRIALLIALGLGAALALAVLFGRRLTRPIRDIAEALRLRAAGRTELAIPESGPREVAAMAAELNRSDEGRRLAERVLRESEARFRALWETSSDAILMIDEGSIIRYANPAVREVFGYEPPDLIGRELAMLQPQSLAQVHRAGMRRYLQSGEKRLNWRSTLTTGRRKGGAEFPLEVSFSELYLDGRRYFAGYLRDVSERARLAQEGEVLLARMQMHRERMPIACLLLDAADLITYANPAAERMFGYSAAELLGRRPADLYVPAERRALVEQLFARLRRGEHAASTGESLRKGGARIHVEWVATPLYREDGSYDGHISMATDITERLREHEQLAELMRDLEERVRRRTAELEAANQELEAFSYSVSHDLRAPLRHIDGFVRMLAKEVVQPSEKALHYLNTISTSARRMGALIDDLLQFSRTSRQSLSLRRVELRTLVRELIAEAASEVGQRKLEWSVGELPAVMADAALLRILLQNLLANAIKYTRSRPLARIAVAAQALAAGDTAISVRDNGVGFDMRFKEKLFGVFQRLHRDEEFEGTGIGLATARRIVHRHGHRIWAEAELEQGATFTFTMTQAEVVHEGIADTAGRG